MADESKGSEEVATMPAVVISKAGSMENFAVGTAPKPTAGA